MSFVLTPRQQEAQAMLGGGARHNLLVGGSRSGKTFLTCRAIAVRASKAAGSRHLIGRRVFNHVKASVWADTWPKMLKLCFPELAGRIRYDKTDFRAILPNESEVWFGGFDDKERTEKILGQEYATIFINEASQVGWGTVETVRTRLAQRVPLDDGAGFLKLKLYYDANPPLATHWTHKLFVEKRSPIPPYAPLSEPEQYAWMRINPADNTQNLPPEYLQELASLGARARLRFLEGQWGSANENALWTYEGIEATRVLDYPDLVRVVVAVDPSGTHGEEDERSDHVGIVVVGLGIDGEAYLLEDLTVKAPPEVWGKIAVHAYDRHQADRLVGEINFGGAMVGAVVRAAASKERLNVNFREVTASRGKAVRAEPISALYDQGKVHHVGAHPELEDQLCAFTSAGYMGDRSPDRADAAIWALTDLFPGMTRRAPRNTLTVETCSSYRGV
jgi:phage terminase large subunit-like protein